MDGGGARCLEARPFEAVSRTRNPTAIPGRETVPGCHRAWSPLIAGHGYAAGTRWVHGGQTPWKVQRYSQGWLPDKRWWCGAGSPGGAEGPHRTMLSATSIFHAGPRARCLPMDPPLGFDIADWIPSSGAARQSLQLRVVGYAVGTRWVCTTAFASLNISTVNFRGMSHRR